MKQVLIVSSLVLTALALTACKFDFSGIQF